MEILDNLDPLLRILWFVAIPTSVIFLIQAVMTFMGADASDGIEADFDGDFEGVDAPFQLFSFRNLVNFLLGFSWGGISLFSSIENRFLLIFLAIVIGTMFVLLFFFIIKQIQRLSEDNSFRMTETLNKTAEVYLSIPAEKKGLGKVLISVKGSTRELEAMTEGARIETGSVVKVVRVEGESVLIVEKI
jgi:membrane protein implicated in regulation of membrane protease activity